MRVKKWALMGILCGTMVLLAGCGKAQKAYKQAVALAENGSYEKAAASFKEAIAENKDKAEYYIDYGMTLNHLGSYKKAIKQFEKAYQKVDNKISRQNNKRLYYGEALAYYGIHEYDKAKKQCDKALEISESKVLNGDIYATLAMAQWASGDSLGALGALDQLIKENAKDADGLVLRGQIKQSMGKYDSAAEDFLKAISVDEKCYEAYFGCYNVYNDAGRESDAKDVFEKLVSIHGADAEAKTQIGRAYICLDKLADAEDILSDAEKEKSTDALFYQGKVLRIRGDFENAIKKYTKYLKAQNGAVCALPEVYSELAGCYIELQDYGQAEDYLEQGLDLGVTMAYQNLLRNRVILLERMGKMRQAKELAAEYLQTYPYDKEMAKEAKFIATRIGNHSKKKQR